MIPHNAKQNDTGWLMTYIYHHVFSIGCTVPPAGHRPLLLRCHPSSHAPLLLPFIPTRFAVGRVLVGTSNTFSSYPRPTVKATSANPAETGDRIRNEQLESQTWWSNNQPGGQCRRTWKHLELGWPQQEEAVLISWRNAAVCHYESSIILHCLACSSQKKLIRC